MTRREQLTAMRPRDLIALADGLGVKVAASRNRVNLKEKKSDVVDRILIAEGDSSIVEVDTADKIDSVVDTAVNMGDTVGRLELIDLLENISDVYPEFRAVHVSDEDWELGDLYDIVKGDRFVASVLPCADEVFVTIPEVKSIGYDKIEDWFENVLAVAS